MRIAGHKKTFCRQTFVPPTLSPLIVSLVLLFRSPKDARCVFRLFVRLFFRCPIFLFFSLFLPPLLHRQKPIFLLLTPLLFPSSLLSCSHPLSFFNGKDGVGLRILCLFFLPSFFFPIFLPFAGVLLLLQFLVSRLTSLFYGYFLRHGYSTHILFISFSFAKSN
ncbi:hypothetical protein ASPWEDRAFT_579145 [Aspergillus wentii DTO 134E9]|uniref:Transmembrane protein n=1 Tax=Aspergillus wentii DTO 134E9 TaxID=1073089 RepID=A0A1L9RHF4_ASPWE|nr:uncharacterized protein ASPWEDRAFT_579145 [Aspergillus wentii DTO 134E9]OJJ34355.1 hypothetical protein ASPWEDRAFT_579145 [Aspergillus wentii DTO 134E9]